MHWPCQCDTAGEGRIMAWSGTEYAEKISRNSLWKICRAIIPDLLTGFKGASRSSRQERNGD